MGNIIIIILIFSLWLLYQFFKTEKSNSKYWKSEYDKLKNENFELMRQIKD